MNTNEPTIWIPITALIASGVSAGIALLAYLRSGRALAFQKHTFEADRQLNIVVKLSLVELHPPLSLLLYAQITNRSRFPVYVAGCMMLRPEQMHPADKAVPKDFEWKEEFSPMTYRGDGDKLESGQSATGEVLWVPGKREQVALIPDSKVCIMFGLQSGEKFRIDGSTILAAVLDKLPTNSKTGL